MSGGGKTGLGLDSNLAALLCYILTPCCFLGVILSLILFFTEKENRFVRFHAVQELLLFGVMIGIGIVFGIITRLLLISDMGILIWGVLGIRVIIGLIFLGVCIFAGIQAYQNKWFKFPIIGDLAEQWSNS